ncbi:hypothetical protein Y032_0007g3538 [Ancylostoma ceylanicum]|uniref:Secreted protein n=1 Tax=Ancylostoma ceylanicum TaxID=53326 RepID=A0A016VN46_9BILA|nr:hypothetical protein Y032_0007g3538 [Ancylostoma ceylanicum]
MTFELAHAAIIIMASMANHAVSESECPTRSSPQLNVGGSSCPLRICVSTAASATKLSRFRIIFGWADDQDDSDDDEDDEDDDDVDDATCRGRSAAREMDSR